MQHITFYLKISHSVCRFVRSEPFGGDNQSRQVEGDVDSIICIKTIDLDTEVRVNLNIYGV